MPPDPPTDAVFVNAASEANCGTGNTESGAFACSVEPLGFGDQQRREGILFDEKASPGGLTICQQHIYRLSSCGLLPELISRRFTWCPSVVVISRFVCAGPAATGFTVTSSGSCSECSA